MAVNPWTQMGTVPSGLRIDRAQIGQLPSNPSPVAMRGSLARPPARALAPRRERAGLALEIVTSHVESLIERVVGVEKAVPDEDGDYPVRFRDAVYIVRVTGPEERPVVKVFSQVVSNVAATPEVYETINEVNTQLTFCRCFLVEDRVYIETEHLGMTVRTDDFRELTENVASASDYFGSLLAERFGGRLPFSAECDSDSGSVPLVASPTGLYL